jgi:hypothetical protein
MQRWVGTSGLSAATAFQTGRVVDDQEFGRLHEIVEQRPPGGLALATHVFHDEQNLLAWRTPEDDESDIDVAFLSSRTRTTVPWRVSRRGLRRRAGASTRLPNPSSPSAKCG